MCLATLPGGDVVTLTYDAAGGVDRHGEFLLALGNRRVPVAVPRPRYLTWARTPRTRDRLSFTETTAFRLEDHIARDLRLHFDVSPKDARVTARNLLWQMVRAHPGLVSFSTEIPRWAAEPPCA